MLGRGIRLALVFFTFAAANSAGAQGNLDQGKTGPQLFASACATCHKSPQSVTQTKWFFGLESFLREHYTSSHESAAILASYLKAQVRPAAQSQRDRLAGHTSQAKPSEPMPHESDADVPRPPADIPNIK